MTVQVSLASHEKFGDSDLEIDTAHRLNLPISRLRANGAPEAGRIDDLSETCVQRVGKTRRRETQLRRICGWMVEHLTRIDAQLYVLPFTDSE